jgi:hypothetical protein
VSADTTTRRMSTKVTAPERAIDGLPGLSLDGSVLRESFLRPRPQLSAILFLTLLLRFARHAVVLFEFVSSGQFHLRFSCLPSISAPI